MSDPVAGDDDDEPFGQTRNATYTPYSYRRNDKESPKRKSKNPYRSTIRDDHFSNNNNKSYSSCRRRIQKKNSWSRPESESVTLVRQKEQSHHPTKERIIPSNQEDSSSVINNSSSNKILKQPILKGPSRYQIEKIKSNIGVSDSSVFHYNSKKSKGQIFATKSKKWKRSESNQNDNVEKKQILNGIDADTDKSKNINSLSSMTKTKYNNGLVLKSSTTKKNDYSKEMPYSKDLPSAEKPLLGKKDFSMAISSNQTTYINQHHTEITQKSWRRTSSKSVKNDFSSNPSPTECNPIRQSNFINGRSMGPVIKRIRLNNENDLPKVGQTSDNDLEHSCSKANKGLTDFAYRETSSHASTKSNSNLNMGLVRVKPDESKTPICKMFARGIPCTNVFCTKRHDVPVEAAMPLCSYFQRHGQCLRIDTCPFRHIKVNPRATDCPSFTLLGFCEDPNCVMKHIRKRIIATSSSTKSL